MPSLIRACHKVSEFGDLLQGIESSCSCVGMASSGFEQREFLGEEIVICSRLFPPLNGKLLPRSSSHITAGSRCEVAWDRRLNVDALLHADSNATIFCQPVLVTEQLS